MSESHVSSTPPEPDDPRSNPPASPRPATTPPRVDLKQLLNDGDTSVAPAPEPPKDSATPAPSAASNADPEGKISDLSSSPDPAGDSIESLQRLLDEAKTAAGQMSVPVGAYFATLIRRRSGKTRKGLFACKLTFEIESGPYAKCLVWHNIVVTKNTIPFVSEQLAEVDATQLSKINDPLKGVYRCELNIAMEMGNDGIERTRVRRFKVLRVDPVELNPFAPRPVNGGAI